MNKYLIVSVLAVALALPLITGCSEKETADRAAYEVVAHLPEVQTFIEFIQASGDDVQPVVMLGEDSTGPGDDYILLIVAEEHPSHVVTWQRFFVSKKDGSILVEDILNDGYLTLAEWREKYAEEIQATETALNKLLEQKNNSE